jgi:hypothetical protein
VLTIAPSLLHRLGSLRGIIMKGATLLFAVLGITFTCVANAQTIEQIEEYERRIDEQQRQLDALRAELDVLKKVAGMPVSPDEEEATLEVAETLPDSAPESKPFLERRSDNGTFTLGGRLHRVLMQVDDGASSNGFFMDSNQGPTMLRADVFAPLNGGWRLSGALEVGIQSNRPDRVTQDNPSPGTDITVREADVELHNDKVGTFSFGRGFAAAWVVPEIDLSGTVPSSLIAVGNLAPGMRFVDRTNDELSDISVNQHFADTERLLLVDRLRYDSPRLGGGFQLSGTVAADSRWDAALRYYPSNDDWTIRAAATYQHKPFQDLDYRVELGLSARHNRTGLSLTTGLLFGDASGRDASGYIVKAGWLTNLTSLGSTAFSADFSSGSDIRLPDDDSESVGFFVQQKLDAVGLDVYGGYRRYKVDRPDFDLRPLKVVVLGAMYTF